MKIESRKSTINGIKRNMDSNELKQRTKDFSHRCVKLALSLPKNVLSDHIRKQLIRCSTSVSSNYRATLLAQSKSVFIAKSSIVIEESDVPINRNWLEFITDEKLIDKEYVFPLLNESRELTSIFISTKKTAQRNR
ncbi:MAG: four helix bundle protein [Candidatus Marinimicrobia bacterium]|nr:four helix bundle protein [Candidatus Neomarinimicrobiota bacterium]